MMCEQLGGWVWELGRGRAGVSNRNRWSFHEQEPRPSAPDTAAVPETGPGGRREERGRGPMMFRRERNEISIMGPTHLSRGNTRGAV